MDGRTQCVTCTHRASFHIERSGPCRTNGCPCQLFVDPDAPLVPEEEPVVETHARRIAIDVPDGYMVSVSLVPYTVAEAADGS